MPAEYRNKNDAKVAVVQLAFEQGALEFLRFSGEPPPEGYKVEMPAPRETKKAKRKATATEAVAENEDGNPKKKAKLLSQASPAALPSKPIPAVLPPKPSMATVLASENTPMFLPRPGYIDSKPEPGELPDEPPMTPVPRHHAARAHEPPSPPRPIMEPRSEPRGGGHYDYDYGVHEHGRQYVRYDDLDGYPTADPYYASPTPATHPESWHAHPRAYPSEDDDEYLRAAYYAIDYAVGYEYDDYTTRRRYTPPPPPPPEPAHHAYDNQARRDGYEDAEYAAYARPAAAAAEYNYAHMPPALRRTQQHTSPPLLSPSPPPRVWQPGPHAPPSPPPAPPAPSSLGICTSSVHHSHSITPMPVPVPELTTSTYSSKDELIGAFFVLFVPSCQKLLTGRRAEYCKANAHPSPKFEESAADTAPSRYKVWIVLGQERLELPTTYVTVEDGEEKLARKVLQRLRTQDAGKSKRAPE